MIHYQNTDFLISAHKLSQLPDTGLPEIAFAGRSNVGKSSLMNRLLGRKNFVKVSSKPGKTQALNYFDVNNQLYLVDLPGYGYAQVAKKTQAGWQELITSYLETRPTLRCVVVIIDLRHLAKKQDFQLLQWLRSKNITFLTVYTKADKLSANERTKNGTLLDAGLNISSQQRILFSAKSGLGLSQLKDSLESVIQIT